MKEFGMITVVFIALASLIPATSYAQPPQRPDQEIIVHGFRSPSIGVEVRRL